MIWSYDTIPLDDEIMTYGRIRTGGLGIAKFAQVVDADKGRAVGLQIVQLQPNSVAEVAGLAIGDILISLDGKPVVPVKQFVGYAEQWKPGQHVRGDVIGRGRRAPDGGRYAE